MNRSDPGRKYWLAYTALWILAILTVGGATIMLIKEDLGGAVKVVTIGIGAVSGLCSVYLGGQSWIDRHHGEPKP